MSLSVIVITRNAGETLERCLESVKWAGEIVVLDSGSTDDTLAIARRFSGKVEAAADWPGFGPQKNRALDRATGDWVLSLDADEWVTPALRAEIEAALARSDGPVAYRLPRLSTYCGRTVRHSGWWPDYVVRLFRRGRARFSEDLVHERVIVEAPPATLASPLMHEAIRSPEQALDKINAYSSAGARDMQRAGKRGSLTAACLHGGWAFFRTYCLRLGFLDGRAGFMVAVMNAESSYHRYVKLMLLAREKPGIGNR